MTRTMQTGRLQRGRGERRETLFPHELLRRVPEKPRLTGSQLFRIICSSLAPKRASTITIQVVSTNLEQHGSCTRVSTFSPLSKLQYVSQPCVPFSLCLTSTRQFSKKVCQMSDTVCVPLWVYCVEFCDPSEVAIAFLFRVDVHSIFSVPKHSLTHIQ